MSFDAGAVVGKLEMSVQGWKKSVETVEKDQQSMSGFAMRHKDEIQKLGKEFAVAGAAITGALTAMVVLAAQAGDMFDEMADKTGVSVETLSTLKLAGDKAGASIEAIAVGMKFLGSQMIETSTATDKSKTLLGALGVAATDTTGQLRPVNDVLFEVADKFKNMENGVVKTKLAVGLFGKSGMDLIPVLNMGKQGLMDNEEAARKLGLEWSGPSSKAASAFADSLVDLKAAGEGFGKTIGEMLMPMMQGIVEKVVSVISSFREWAAAHPQLTTAISSMAFVLGGILTVVGSLIFIIPTLVTHFAAFAAILGTTSAALAISLGGLAAIAAAAVFAYNTINDLTNATNYATDSAGRVDREYTNTGKKLREVANACGLTRAEYVKLQDKYQNVTAMEIAIRKGQEGVEMQKALAKYGKEHGAVLDDQAKKSGAFSTEIDKLLAGMGKAGTATKTIKDELGLVFNAELQARIEMIQKALADYKGQLSTESEKKLREELTKLQANFQTATGPARDLKDVLAKAGGTMESTGFYAHTLDGEIEKLANKMSMSIATVKLMAYEIMRLNLAYMGIHMPDLRLSEQQKTAVATDVKTFSDSWAGSLNQLSQQFGQTFSSFVETWSWDKIINGKIDFKSFFGDIWKNIKDTFFQLVGELATKWLKDFVEGALSKGTAKGAAAAATSIMGGIGDVAGAGAKAVTGAATGVIDTISGVVTAVTGVLDLLKGPQKQTDVTYWLKMIKDLNQEMHDMFRDLIAIMVYEQGQGDEKWFMMVEANNLAKDANGLLSNIWGETAKVVAALATVPKAATGAIFQSPTLAWVAEKKAEAVLPLDQLAEIASRPAGAMAGGGSAGAEQRTINTYLTANFNISALDGADVRSLVRERIGPEFVDWIRGNLGKTGLKEALGV